jgi:arginase family enzyme
VTIPLDELPRWIWNPTVRERLVAREKYHRENKLKGADVIEVNHDADGNAATVVFDVAKEEIRLG